jgi:RNA polymerase sigma-70 factor (ECF subfamily)
MNDASGGIPDPRSEPGSISSTLLDRVKACRPEAWERLADLYGPVVYGWCRHAGVGRDAAAEVVQEVFVALAAHVVDFRRDRPGDSFGAWLRTITRNKVLDYFRVRRGRPAAEGGSAAQAQLLRVPALAEPSAGGVSAEVYSVLLRRGLELVRAEFETRTWDAFWQAAVEGQLPAAVAADLGMSVQAVYKAKSRVLRRLRQELDGLLE